MAGPDREQIVMTAAEVDAFLGVPRTLNVATIGPSGHPHLVAMWYGFLDGKVAFWTFAKSQKILNLRRSPLLSALAEEGMTYATLKGCRARRPGSVGRGSGPDPGHRAERGRAPQRSGPRRVPRPGPSWRPRRPSGWAWSSMSTGWSAGTTPARRCLLRSSAVPTEWADRGADRRAHDRHHPGPSSGPRQGRAGGQAGAGPSGWPDRRRQPQRPPGVGGPVLPGLVLPDRGDVHGELVANGETVPLDQSRRGHPATTSVVDG